MLLSTMLQWLSLNIWNFINRGIFLEDKFLLMKLSGTNTMGIQNFDRCFQIVLHGGYSNLHSTNNTHIAMPLSLPSANTMQ